MANQCGILGCAPVKIPSDRMDLQIQRVDTRSCGADCSGRYFSRRASALLKLPSVCGQITLFALALSLTCLDASAAAQLPSKPTGPIANPRAAATPGQPCKIIGINAATGVVTAKINSTGQTFQFAVKDATLLHSLKLGQSVYANFNTHQVSVGASCPCWSITNLAKPSGQPLKAPQSAQQPAKSSAPQGTRPFGIQGMRPLTLTPVTLPTASVGPPHPAPPPPRPTAPGVVVSIFGRGGTAGNPNVLLGIEGIKQAQGLSQDAKNLLLLHARTLPPSEVDHYVVNPQLAEQWFKTHPVPPSVKKAAEGGGGSGGTNCTVSTDNIGGLVSHAGECAQKGAEHASEELARQSEALRKQAGDEWRHISDEATHDWQMTEDCFADHTLHVSDIPVQFSILPQFPLSYETSGKKTVLGGTASGKVSGQVNIGIPVDADFKVKLDLFYIPCLPFAVRPRMIAGDGTLTVGSKLDGTLKANGQFKDTFTIPPTGGPKIPIQVYPIVIGGVPISELDVSLYLEGTVYVEADGALDGSFNLENRQKTAFLFECSGAGCYSISHAKPVPESAAEKLNLKGRVRVKPAFYAALQLDVDWEALSARAGPQPYLLGELSGCSSTSATQTTAGSSTQESYALTADLDWGIELRAEALAGGKKLADPLIVPILPPHHIAFWDLGGSNPSNALVPAVEGSQQAAVGKTAQYKLKMGSCYPYTDPVTYQVKWTGGASATGNTAPTQTRNTPAAQQQANAARPAVTLNRPFGVFTGVPNSVAPQPPACTWQTDQATCEGNPQKDIALNLVWPQTGTGQNTLTVLPVRDKHGRVFTEKAAQVDINVQQPTPNGAGQACSSGGVCAAGLVCQNGICTSKTP